MRPLEGSRSFGLIETAAAIMRPWHVEGLTVMPGCTSAAISISEMVCGTARAPHGRPHRLPGLNPIALVIGNADEERVVQIGEPLHNPHAASATLCCRVNLDG